MYCKYTFHRERSAPSSIILYEYEIKRKEKKKKKEAQEATVNCELPPIKNYYIANHLLYSAMVILGTISGEQV